MRIRAEDTFEVLGLGHYMGGVREYNVAVTFPHGKNGSVLCQIGRHIDCAACRFAYLQCSKNLLTEKPRQIK